MLQTESKLKSADNTGAKKLKIIRVLGGYRKRYAGIGDIVTASVWYTVAPAKPPDKPVLSTILIPDKFTMGCGVTSTVSLKINVSTPVL